RCVRGLDRSIAEDIVMKVEIAVLELVVKEDHSPNSDFLEVSLVQAVQRRTLDAIRNYKRSPMGRRGTVPAAVAIDDNDEDGDEIERPIEFVADGRPGPQDIL